MNDSDLNRIVAFLVAATVLYFGAATLPVLW